jgi:uncharacterized protein with GYD domain
MPRVIQQETQSERCIVAEFRPMSKFLFTRSLMPFYLHQVSYTPEALARLIAEPHDRFEAVRVPVEKLGGKIKDSYFAFGLYDAVVITEMPDNVAAAAIALAFSAGGALRNCQTTALMTTSEGLDAMRKAGTCGYKPITSSAAAGR